MLDINTYKKHELIKKQSFVLNLKQKMGTLRFSKNK